MESYPRPFSVTNFLSVTPFSVYYLGGIDPGAPGITVSITFPPLFRATFRARRGKFDFAVRGRAGPCSSVPFAMPKTTVSLRIGTIALISSL